MKAIYNTLLNIIKRADFFYPMCELGYMNACRDFEADRSTYFKIIEGSDLNEDEKEAFRHLWTAKQDACNASMSMNGTQEKIADALYQSTYKLITGGDLA